MTAEEREASEELLRKVDQAVAAVRREATGLEQARNRYRSRQEGTR